MQDIELHNKLDDVIDNISKTMSLTFQDKLKNFNWLLETTFPFTGLDNKTSNLLYIVN